MPLLFLRDGISQNYYTKGEFMSDKMEKIILRTLVSIWVGIIIAYLIWRW